MAQRYPYLPLKASEQQIRLLTLFPGKFPSKNEAASPIEIQFQIISFAAANSQEELHARYGWRNIKRLVKQVRRPKYEALSYTWGEERSRTRVVVKSHGSERSFLEVTQNLATALIYLRHNSKARVLWIDALVSTRRTWKSGVSQVARMADIYRLAHRLLVWLGPENEEERSSEALSILRSIGSQVEIDWTKLEMRATNQGDSSLVDRSIPLILDHNSRLSLFMVIIRPWFERLWVQQEIALANDNALLICGHDSITRRHFTNALYCIRYNGIQVDGEPRRRLFRHRVELILEMSMVIYGSHCRNIEDTLRSQAGKLKCSDARDRIFAVLSTRNAWDKRVSIEVDYSKTTEEVYREFAVKQILFKDKLGLFTACEGKTDHTGIHNPMPSWAPDWRRPLVTEPIKEFFASGRSSAGAQFDCKLETLTLSGVRCATVAHVKAMPSLFRLDWRVPHTFTYFTQDCIQFWGLSEWYVTGETTHEAHIRTLCGNHFPENLHPRSSNLATYEISSSTIKRFWQGRVVDETGNLIEPAYTIEVMSKYLRSCRERSCFTTTEGYIGLAPMETKSGDIICVLLGSDVPIVLRPQGEEKYSVVGACYCHGIMDGSVLLGPLPAGFAHVLNFVQDWKAYYNAFIDRRSRKVQGEDPRLAGYPLPHGWRIDTFCEDTTVLFVQENDDGTVKERTVRFDPRMTPDELRKRGVNVVKFDLI